MLPFLQYGSPDLIDTMPGAGIFAALMAYTAVMFVLMIGLYIYSSLTLMTVAKRLKTEPAWLAWLPVGNLVLMSKLAKMHWWPVLLLLVAWIPFLGFIALIAFMVFLYVWWWKICEARGRPGWYALLALIPIVGGLWGLVLWGILAWSKK